MTLLLAFLLALAPAAPGEELSGHVHSLPLLSAAQDHAHGHGAMPDGHAGAETPAAECSLIGGHCVVALVTPIRDFSEVGFNVATRSAVLGSRSSRGIVLTSEPPPPRA